MNEIIRKLKSVRDSINSDEKFGKIFLFALLERTDLEDKWDILISAEKLKENNTKEDLTYIIELLKKEFIDDLGFLSQIVLIKPNDEFIKDFARSFKINKVEEEEIFNLKLLDNFTIKHAHILDSDFSTIDTTQSKELERKEGTDSFV